METLAQSYGSEWYTHSLRLYQSVVMRLRGLRTNECCRSTFVEREILFIPLFVHHFFLFPPLILRPFSSSSTFSLFSFFLSLSLSFSLFIVLILRQPCYSIRFFPSFSLSGQVVCVSTYLAGSKSLNEKDLDFTRQ